MATQRDKIIREKYRAANTCFIRSAARSANIQSCWAHHREAVDHWANINKEKMGMATRLYGCIVEYGLQIGAMQSEIYAHNKAVISRLPENDQWPPLSKKMFAITENSGEHTPDYSYSGRMIHFGANFKSIEYEWLEWKIKFEDLLTKLLWLEADVHFKTEYADIQTFKWRVDLKKWTLYDKMELEPIKKEYWDFEGEINWGK